MSTTTTPATPRVRRTIWAVVAAVALAATGGAVASAHQSGGEAVAIPEGDPAAWELTLGSRTALDPEGDGPAWGPVSLPDGTYASDGEGNFALVDIDQGLDELDLAEDPVGAEATGDGDGDGSSEGAAEAILVSDHLDELDDVGAVRYVPPGHPELMQWCAVSALEAGTCAFGQSVEEANALATEE